jgi:hypothetical protein
MIAPFALAGPINREAFETYVERVLLPEIRPGDVVMGQLQPQGVQGPRLIEAAGARLLLPPPCPDFNPIENAFAKFKALLRKTAERTFPGLSRSAASSSSSVQPYAWVRSGLMRCPSSKALVRSRSSWRRLSR